MDLILSGGLYSRSRLASLCLVLLTVVLVAWGVRRHRSLSGHSGGTPRPNAGPYSSLEGADTHADEEANV